MLVLLKVFWGISVLKTKPQEIPRSAVLLALTATINFLISIAITEVSIDLPLSTVLLLSTAEISIISGLTATLLIFQKKESRLIQSITALLGAGAIIGLVVLILFAVLPEIPAILRLTIFFWNLIVVAFVLHHALEFPMAGTFLISVAYTYVIMQVIVRINQMFSTTPL
jgi:hypothetical protein